MENNVIANSTSAAVIDNGSYTSALVARNNNYFNVTTTSYSASPNTGHITTDPKVEDDDWDAYPRWWDGKLWAESLAINAGYATATDLPTRDILGNARKIGAAVDIGAFEFDPSANKEPRADACTASLIVPRGESFTLDGSKAVDPDGFIASAYWTMSDGTVTAGQSVTHTFANAGDTQWAYITVVDDKGAEDHALVKVNVDIRPIADAGPAVFQDQGPAEEVFFDGTLSTDPDGQVVGWSWNFGDGTPVSTEKSPRHSYLSAGVYTVTLTVTDNEGLTHSDTTLATVYGTNDTVGPHVQHTEIADGVPVNTAVVVQADITDPSGVASAVVLYRPIGGTTAQFVSMTQVGTTNTWKATIPAAGVTSAGVEYWFVCADAATPNANSSTTPANAPTGGVYNFLVVGDPNPPTIVHTEISDGQTTGQAVAVSATITDATGVAKANLYFRPKGGTSFGAAPMAKISGNTWSAQIPAFVVTSPGVEYYLEATDTSPIPNTGYAPANAPAGVYDFTVGSGDVTPPIIAHTPITNGKPAGSAVAVTCSAADNIGVTGVMLYYRVTGAGAFTATALAASGGTSWSGNIPAAAVTTAGVDYYLVASDAAANHASSPDTAPTTWNSFTVVAVDTSAPTIVHTAIPNGQAAGSSPVVTATITDTSGVASAKLLYRPHGFPVFQEVAMTANGNTWTASIPSFVVTPPSVEYYIRASDTPGNIGNYPAGGAAAPIVFTVVDGTSDTTAPNIVHDPIANGQTAGQAIAISALVSDGTGVASVTLRYRAIGTSSWTVLAMVAGASSSWSATIPVAAVKAPGLEYYLEAVDSSAAANKSTAPAAGANGPYSFAVNDVDATPPTIVHTTVTSIEAGSPLAISATISDDDEVASATLRWAPGAAAFASIAMVKTTGATWTATVPAASIPAGTTSLRYVITAVDPTGNSASHPTTGEANPHVVSVTDTVAPVVTVGAIADGKTAGSAVPVTATVTDVNPVSAVTLYYKTTGSAAAYASVAMTGAAGSYTASIPAATVVLPGVSYYVSASDGSNVGYGPATAPATPAAFTVVNGCSDECTAAAKRCSGNAVETCGNYDADACTEWGGSSACGATQTCTNGACVAAPPADLVINEVLYDDVGTDVNAFVEIYGPPSTSLVGYSLVGVNGNGGTEFNTIALTGSTGADGFYVVAKTGSNAAILAAADQTSANADYQNGPDNIQLRQGTTVVDAVGYGTFAVGDVFAGEEAAVAGVTSGVSIGRDASATDTDANVDDFYPQLAWTPGAPNQAKLSAVPVAHASCPTSGSVGVALTLDGSGSTDDGSITAYDWSFGDTQSGSGASVQHTYAAAGTFVVTLTVTDDQHQTDTDTCSIAVTVADTAGPTIVHTPSAGPLAAGQPLSVSANITDASGVASAKLHWRTKGATAYTVVNMTGSAGTYTATIASLAAPGVEYWIDATDSKGNAAALPLTAPTVFFAIDVYVPDTTAPAIVHTPVSGNHAVGVAVALEATVTDASGIWRQGVLPRVDRRLVHRGRAHRRRQQRLQRRHLRRGHRGAGRAVLPAGRRQGRAGQHRDQPRDRPGRAPQLHGRRAAGSTRRRRPSPTRRSPGRSPTASRSAATATDTSNVASLTLYFRPQGSPTWLSLPLTPTTGSYGSSSPRWR
ncbi:MAG: PKD domain-containing protein [Myxococcota bacterium]